MIFTFGEPKRVLSSAWNDQRAQLKRPASIRFLPQQMIGVGQHLGHFKLAGLDQPSIENFVKQVAFEIDENRFGVLVPAFGSATTQSLFGWTNVNTTGPLFALPQTFDCHH